MFRQSSDYISWPITTHGQIRRLPHQGARHSTVDHGDASDGVFLLLHLWVLPSSWAILLRRSPFSLSLACGWPLGANGSPSCEWRRLQGLRVEDPSSARKGGPNRPRDWARLAGLGRPAQAVTPDFPKKTKCKPICMPGSSFMHIVTNKCIQKQYHIRKRKIIRDLRFILETKAPNITGNQLGVAYT
jgi:hypothetical protein